MFEQNFSQMPPWGVVQQSTFYIIALAMIIGAVMVVTLRNVFHCALALALVAVGAAGLYLMLDAEFLAVVQILVYVGAVITLIAFVIMLTQRATGVKMKQSNEQKFLSLFVSCSILYLLVTKLPTVPWKTETTNGKLADVETIGNALLTTYLLPFEVISVVLLVALIGAIVLARREHK
jgi:NADH:ubiquinone oxidoreductase subunit 6 (subunit J)